LIYNRYHINNLTNFCKYGVNLEIVNIGFYSPVLYWLVIFGNVRLDIQDRSASDQVQAGHFNLVAADAVQLGQGQPNRVGPVR
jgi:hypothetical protein